MKSRTTIPQRYEAGEFAIYILLFVLTLIGFAAAFGCAGADEYHDELGEIGEGLISKQSTTYSYGVLPNLQNAPRAGSPGGVRIVPGRQTIRYKLVGTDNCDDGDPFHADYSWKKQVRRGVTDPGAQAGAAGFGNPWTVIEDNANPSVIFQRGTCAGRASGGSMNALVCPSFADPLVTITALGALGTYKRHDGVLTMNIDVDDAFDTFIRSPMSCASDSEFHELLEHMGHVAGIIPYGQGLYPADVTVGGFHAWTTPVVRPGGSYAVSGFPAGQLCRLGSYRTSLPTSQLLVDSSGTCAD